MLRIVKSLCLLAIVAVALCVIIQGADAKRTKIQLQKMLDAGRYRVQVRGELPEELAGYNLKVTLEKPASLLETSSCENDCPEEEEEEGTRKAFYFFLFHRTHNSPLHPP